VILFAFHKLGTIFRGKIIKIYFTFKEAVKKTSYLFIRHVPTTGDAILVSRDKAQGRKPQAPRETAECIFLSPADLYRPLSFSRMLLRNDSRE
jgi:hypothetical protein